MKIPNMQLFLDRFISVNRDRYKNAPAVITILDSLTLETVIFSEIRTTVDESGNLVRTVDIYVPKVMKAMNQSWLPAYYTTPRITDMVTQDVQVENSLINLTVPGIYFYQDRNKIQQGCLVVPANIEELDIPQYVVSMVLLANQYQINDTQLAVAADFSTVIIDTPTIYQNLKLVLSLKSFTFNIPETDYLDLTV